MNTFIIFDNVKRAYACFSVIHDEVLLPPTHWVRNPSDATPINKLQADGVKIKITHLNGPSLDGSVEIKDQINEVNKNKSGRYRDSEDYEDGDETDTA